MWLCHIYFAFFTKKAQLCWVSDRLLNPDMLLQTPPGFHLGICCDGFCVPSSVFIHSGWTTALQGVTLILRAFSSAPPCRPGPTQRRHSSEGSVYPRTIPSTTLVICLNFVADVSWGRTRAILHASAISADVWGVSYGGAHKQTNPQVTRRRMWTPRDSDVWKNNATTGSGKARRERLARSSDHIAAIPRVLFSTACFKRAESADADNPADQNLASNTCRSKPFRLVSFYLFFFCLRRCHSSSPTV